MEVTVKKEKMNTMTNTWRKKFGNGKGIEKTHSLNSGTGREWKKIPKIREWEENEKSYSQNSGTGRE